MIERRNGARFVFEQGQSIDIVVEPGRQELDRDWTIELFVGGAVHDAHTTFTNPVGDAVSSPDQLPEMCVCQFRHFREEG